MDINEEQTQRYIRDLMSLRNDRLTPLNPEEDTFGGLVADAMNSLEIVYVVYRGLLEAATPQDPFLGGIKSGEIQLEYEE